MTRAALRALLSLALLTLGRDARADEPATAQAQAAQAGQAGQAGQAAQAPQAQGARTPASEERAVAKARELLERARFLDESATADEKALVDLDKRLPALRLAARAARDRANRTREGDADRDALLAKAEDLEVDVAVTEAELSVKRRSGSDNRRVARDLRARALRLIKDGFVLEETALASACDPPFRYTPDGRKIYRIECLK